MADYDFNKNTLDGIPWEQIRLHGGRSVGATQSTETRVVDPISGGEKGSKLAQFSLIPAEFLWALAEHYGKGALKYARENWLRGYRWSLSYDALERHLAQWRMGELLDPETGSSHLIAAAWHCIALFIFERRGLGTDDLHPSVTASASAKGNPSL